MPLSINFLTLSLFSTLFVFHGFILVSFLFDLKLFPLLLLLLLLIIIIIIIIVIIISIGFFYSGVSSWSFTGVWVTASLRKSPGIFSVFWPFSIMLSFRWSPLGRQLPSPLVPFSSWKFFSPVVTGSFSLKSEWQQVSSCLQGTSKYSSCSY